MPSGQHRDAAFDAEGAKRSYMNAKSAVFRPRQPPRPRHRTPSGPQVLPQ